MSGWLRTGVEANLKPYDLTVDQYIAELRAQGMGWSEIRQCMKDDEIIPWGKLLAPDTIKSWVS